MCNFQPGEVLAFGPVAQMLEHLSGWVIPGEVAPVALLDPNAEVVGESTAYHGMGFLHVTDVPEGLELLTVSKLSAALADLIGEHRAVVEPNYVLPFSAAAPGAPAAYSAAMQTAIGEVHAQLPTAPAANYRIAVMDSGLSAVPLAGNPTLRCFDYTRGAAAEVPASAVTDQQNHGGLICRIVADVMAGQADLMVGRIAVGRADVTVLSLSLAHAHMVTTTRPDVVNLSVAPRGDVLVCPHCNQQSPLGGLHSLILPRVFALAGLQTWTVIAAGNNGKLSTAAHQLAHCPQMVVACAYGTDKKRAPYSGHTTNTSIPDLPGFGGDDPQMAGGQGVLQGGSYVFGTSFAAPLVTCALAGAIRDNQHLIGAPNHGYEVGVINGAMQTLARSIAVI